jgi:hypothetical protein
MPIRQYFLWVGSILLAALLVADWWLPEPAADSHSQIPPHERVNLQIRSNHKWPERVVFDTAHAGRSFVAEAPEATNDKVSAIPAKPGTEMFRMTGTIKVD